MTKKRLLVVSVLLLALLGIGLGVGAFIPPAPGVTKGNFNRIEMGMTKAEVEKIFGSQGDPYREWVIWWGQDESVVTIRFSDIGVTNKEWRGSDDETFLEKLRRRLHLP